VFACVADTQPAASEIETKRKEVRFMEEGLGQSPRHRLAEARNSSEDHRQGEV